MKATTFLRWEAMLAAVLIAAFIVFSMLSPYFLSVDTLSDATFNFTERAIVALPLALLIIAGEIDISVAAIIALASVAMGLASAQGMGTAGSSSSASARDCEPAASTARSSTIGRVPSIVATIGTMTLFRGAAYAVLGDRVLKDYPDSFATFGQGYLVGPSPSSWHCSRCSQYCSACSCIARAGAGSLSPSAPIRWRAAIRALP
jgi:rhamnose transport system permease protein